MTKPPERIDPDTLTMPLMEATGPLPEGTPIYDGDGHLVATLGKALPVGHDCYEYVVPLIPPEPA